MFVENLFFVDKFKQSVVHQTLQNFGKHRYQLDGVVIIKHRGVFSFI